jgi:hypothetical protein
MEVREAKNPSRSILDLAENNPWKNALKVNIRPGVILIN